jgi:hypothetical protein
MATHTCTCEGTQPGTCLNAVHQVIALLEAEDGLDSTRFQQLFGALIREYSRRSEQTHGHVVPYDQADRVRPTDVLRVTAGLLRESDISSFELAMMMNL